MRGFGLCRGGGEGKHISLAAIFEGKHISLVICVRGHTYHGETHITVTGKPKILSWGGRGDFAYMCKTMTGFGQLGSCVQKSVMMCYFCTRFDAYLHSRMLCQIII